MTDGGEGRFLETFERALELTGDERRDFLDRACEGDSEMREELDRALADEGVTVKPDFLEPVDLPELLLREGVRLGDYEIQRKLGSGGMGVVYLARQVTLDRLVALKVVIGSPDGDGRTVERFHRESRSMASFTHPGIVPVFEEGEEDGVHYFAMEYVDGHNLARELDLVRPGADEGQAPFRLVPAGDPDHARVVAEICIEIAEALEHAHARGFVHRDIKPQNVLIGPDGRVRVVDFGLVRDETMGTITRSGDIAGTVHYMSPEQVQAVRARVDHRTDVYALGVVLYELLTLTRPYEGQSSAEIFRQIAVGSAKSIDALNAAVPRDLQIICFQAMRRSPARRYATAADLAADLTAFLEGRPIAGRRATPVEYAETMFRRYPRASTALGGVIVGLAAAGAVYGAMLSAALCRFDLSRVPGVVAARAYRLAEPELQRTGEPQSLDVDGRTVVEPGYWLIEITGPSGRTAEVVEYVEPRQTIELEPVGYSPVAPEGMVLVEGGELEIGPYGGVEVAVPDLYVDRFEVTNDEYRTFLRTLDSDERSRRRPRFWPADLEQNWTLDIGRRPVTSISCDDADAYARSLGKRLPTAAEWAWIGSGPDRRTYPWAGGPSDGRANTRTTEMLATGRLGLDLAEEQAAEWRQYLDHCVEVGSFEDDRSWCGVHDLLGSVREWTAQPGLLEGGALTPPSMRMVAGLSFFLEVRPGVFEALGGPIPSDQVDYKTGLRCVKSTPVRLP